MADVESPKVRYVVTSDVWMPNLRMNKDEPLHWDVKMCHENGKVFKAHKAILAANAGFFAKTFSPEWIQEGTNKVLLREADVPAASLEPILGAIYSEPFDIDRQNVFDIHSASNFLEMVPLARRCARFLSTHMCIDEVFSTWRYAMSRLFPGCVALADVCENFIDENFSRLFVHPSFPELKAAELKKILSRHTLKVSSEVEIVHSVLVWLLHDWKERFKQGRRLLEHVQWSLVDRVHVATLWSVEKLGEVACQSGREKAVKLAITELLLAPQRHAQAVANVQVAPRRFVRKRKLQDDGSPKLYAYGQKSGLYSPVHTIEPRGRGLFQTLASGWVSWRSAGEEGLTGRRLEKMFSFEHLFIAVSSKDGHIGSFKLHLLKGLELIETVGLAAPTGPPMECYQKARITFAVPLLTFAWLWVPSGGSQTQVQFAPTSLLLTFDLRKLLSTQQPMASSSSVPLRVLAIDHLHSMDQKVTPNHLGASAVCVRDKMYLVGGRNSPFVHVLSFGTGNWSHGPSTDLSCCNTVNYLFVVDGVIYSAGGLASHPGCGKNFEYLVTPDPEETVEPLRLGWRKGPKLARGGVIRCHYVFQNRLHLVGSDAQFQHVVQSLPLDDLDAGWRDDTGVFGTRRPWFVGVVE